MTEFVAAVPWPELFYIGLPAFVAGLISGRFWDVRHDRGQQ